jgi:hypothetical protein
LNAADSHQVNRRIGGEGTDGIDASVIMNQPASAAL